jgi:hypothetical protein
VSVYTAGTTVCLNVEFRDAANALVDPADARFDVVDANGVVVLANVPTTIVSSPGRHKGCYQSSAADTPGEWFIRFKATIDSIPKVENCPFDLISPTGESFGPCQPWAISDDCCDMPEEASQALIDTQNAVATQLLWAASGRRYGPCPVTIRGCAKRCLDAGLPSPYKDGDGAWRNLAVCGCSEACSCTSLSEVVLDGPVAGVSEVMIDGVVFTDWRLDRVGSGWRLVRTDGGMFPACQDMLADCDEDGSFCVTYLRGLPLDELATAAVSDLTCQLVRACVPNCKCELPRNVASVVRRGVAITFVASSDWLKTLPMVAAFLNAVNPEGLTSASSVWTPDINQVRISG